MPNMHLLINAIDLILTLLTEIKEDDKDFQRLSFLTAARRFEQLLRDASNSIWALLSSLNRYC